MKGSLGGLVIVVLCGLGIGLGAWFYQHDQRDYRRAALFQRELAMKRLGQYLARQFPQERALVLSNPFTEMNGYPEEVYEFEKAGVEGLRQGLGDVIPMKVVFPELRPQFFENRETIHVDPQTTTPLSYLTREKAWTDLAEKNPDRTLFISLIGLPSQIRQLEIWKPSYPVKIALLLPDWRVLGNREYVRRAFHSEKIVAAVMNKPDAPPEIQEQAADLEEEFNKRFLLVTPENIDRLMREFPEQF